MMKPIQILSCLLISGCAVCVLSCKKDTRADASRPLQQSFQAAEPAVQQAIGTATTGLKAGNYTQAARALEPVMARGELTPQQRQAIGLTLQQISQAVAANPNLDSKELYELRVKMFHAARGKGF